MTKPTQPAERVGNELRFRSSIESTLVARQWPGTSAAPPAARLSAYLATLAPFDEERLQQFVALLLAELPAPVSTADAVAHAQDRVSSWWCRTFGSADLGDAHARRALARMPSAFLSNDPEQQRDLAQLRLQFAAPVELQAQPMAPSYWRVLIGMFPACSVGVGIAWHLAESTQGTPWLVRGWAALAGVLVALHAHSAALTALGAARKFLVRPPPPHSRLDPASQGPLPPVAIVMPVYEEDPERVFAALAAMRAALFSTGRASSFAFYVLSDTQDPIRAADEERAWRRLAALDDSPLPVYYRRRALNAGRKAGNLAEFAVRNEHRFKYTIVLDADSIMGAGTLLELVTRMEQQPQVGLLQVGVELKGGTTVFARSLQFAHALVGPTMVRGLAAWVGSDGNYFGHNAIIRLSAFVKCCGLPTLAGAPPLGGPVLSHDFVEAALLRRGGWEVRFADDLGESYEEPPPTLGDYLTRDRRWCQGNLQHLRLLAADGLRPMSRVHFLLGALAYLVSPMWLLFITVAVGNTAVGGGVEPETATQLTAVAFAILLLPRLLGLAESLVSRTVGFGGGVRLVASALAELVISALLAPVVMLAQTAFVIEIILGLSVEWNPQRRGMTSVIASLDRRTAAVSIVGLLTAVGLWLWQPSALSATAPIWVPWILAAPLSAALVLPGVSRMFLVSRVLTTPAEHAPPSILREATRHQSYFHADETARFRDVVLDPVLNARRRQQLQRRGVAANEALAPIADKAIARGPAALDASERAALLNDFVQLGRLHTESWRTWPVETWNIPRPVHVEPR